MQRIAGKKMLVVGLVAMLAAACTPRGPVVPPDQPQAPQPTPAPTPAPAPPVVEAPPVPKIDPMADVPGDKPLPLLQGAAERIDCMNGVEDLHARMAFEARGGQVINFAYYSKWKPRTCALDFARNAPGTKWRLTPDGATRVHTPQGRFVIRTRPDAYVFEFQNVERRKFCGMSGEINGTMTIKRGAGRRECTVAGIMDANDEYLDNLRKTR
jgi:hypothetical protein